MPKDSFKDSQILKGSQDHPVFHFLKISLGSKES